MDEAARCLGVMPSSSSSCTPHAHAREKETVEWAHRTQLYSCHISMTSGSTGAQLRHIISTCWWEDEKKEVADVETLSS